MSASGSFRAILEVGPWGGNRSIDARDQNDSFWAGSSQSAFGMEPSKSCHSANDDIADINASMQSSQMRAELRSLDYFESDLSSSDGDAFCVTVTATIGAVGGRGGDNFDFEVCSPAWLRAELASDHVVSGRYRLIMAEFDFPVLERFVAKRVGQTEGPDWDSVATKLSAWTRWEFENYNR